MTKHCKVTYYCPEEQSFCQDKCSMSFDYSTEEEYNEILERFDEEVKSYKFNFEVQRRIHIYTDDEYIAELEENLKDFVSVYTENMGKEKNFEIESSGKKRYFLNGCEVSKDEYAEYKLDEREHAKSPYRAFMKNGEEVEYFNGDKQISREEYEKASLDIQKQNYIRQLKFVGKIQHSQRIIHNEFDTSKLTVDDYNFILLMIANEDGKSVVSTIKELREKFGYAAKAE